MRARYPKATCVLLTSAVGGASQKIPRDPSGGMGNWGSRGVEGEGCGGSSSGSGSCAGPASLLIRYDRNLRDRLDRRRHKSCGSVLLRSHLVGIQVCTIAFKLNKFHSNLSLSLTTY